MKRLCQRNWNQVHWLLGVLLLLGLTALPMTWTAAKVERGIVVGPVVTFNPVFFARSYGGKCLDFGPPPQVSGSPVFIYDCNGTIAQQIRVEEINDRHDVILRAGNKVIGVKSELVIGRAERRAPQLPAPLETETPLELQAEKDRNTVLSRGQIFALDGDSIILASNRDRVVKVQNARGKNRTPLVLVRRDLDDSEFWTFSATDGSNRRPTSGFVRVPVNEALDDGVEFENAVRQAKPGTVIEVDQNASIDLTDQYPILIPEGVTIRGDRRGTRPGPELWVQKRYDKTMLEIAGNDVRITGLRLRGPSRSTDDDGVDSRGILARDNAYLRSIIDHNDISDWTTQAVDVYGDPELPEVCGDDQDPRSSRSPNVRVARNFIHHNQKQEKGYGVEAHYGGFPLIEGNTFVSNRHALMADGKACSIFLAYYNLVLSEAPSQHHLWRTQDFDVHGTGDNGFGGRGGQYVEIARNTFLGKNRANFDLRGEPSYLAEFHHNVSLQDYDEVKRDGDALDCTYCGGGDAKFKIYGNQFNAPNPADSLGVGDFDGDGKDDLLLVTGAAWYYAPEGKAEWRFLNAQTDKIGSLLFGDFDADRRTDVFTQRGREWLVSWAGASRWERINQSDPALSEFRIGDFVGDRRADVFYADGQRWYVSDGGVGPFTHTQDSGYRAANLGFGDFNGDGKMDVVGAVNGKWMVSLSASGLWAGYPLRPALTNTMAGLVIADFNGNGRADIATASVKKVSYDGRGAWAQFPERPGKFAATGRFDANRGADILFFWTDDKYLGIQSSGVVASQRQSRQHMR